MTAAITVLGIVLEATEYDFNLRKCPECVEECVLSFLLALAPGYWSGEVFNRCELLAIRKHACAHRMEVQPHVAVPRRIGHKARTTSDGLPAYTEVQVVAVYVRDNVIFRKLSNRT